MLSPAKAKEKALKALSVKKLMERGWLSALLGYLAKREELKVRLKYIGDVTLRRADFEALAANAYYTAKCWPQLPEELARAAGSLLKPQNHLLGPLNPNLLSGRRRRTQKAQGELNRCELEMPA
ncbi:MAG: hypothetical protein RXO24_10570 [Acidilobus sp.]